MAYSPPTTHNPITGDLVTGPIFFTWPTCLPGAPELWTALLFDLLGLYPTLSERKRRFGLQVAVFKTSGTCQNLKMRIENGKIIVYLLNVFLLAWGYFF